MLFTATIKMIFILKRHQTRDINVAKGS